MLKLHHCKQRLIMKENPPSPKYLNDPSSSAESSSTRGSKGDQEMGNCSISRNRDALEEKITICGFTFPRDLNPVRMVFAEMLGTFILMFSVCGITASTQLMRGEIGLLEYAATGGLSIVVIIFAIGPISGAHVNPSVTLAFAALGHVPLCKVPFYIMGQLLGSLFATYVGTAVYGIQAELMITQAVQGWKTAFWAEFIATLMVVFLAAMMCHTHAIGHLAGIVIGVAIALAILVTGPVSGGSLNPARSLGPAILSWRFKDIWLYILAPTSGAVAGAFLARFLHLKQRSCPPN